MNLFKSTKATTYISSRGDKVYPIVMDIKTGIVEGKAVFTTGDIETAYLYTTILEGQSEYNILGTTVICNIQRPDGTTMKIHGDVQGNNLIEFPLGQSGVSQEGLYNFDIAVVFSEKKMVTSPTAQYSVTQSIEVNGEIEEDDRFPVLEGLINELNEIKEEELSREQAESVRVENEKTRQEFFENIKESINVPKIPTKLSELENDTNFLTTIPDEYVTDAELNGYATENYVKQEIQKIDVTSQLGDYAKKTELHSHSNKAVLDGITSSKVTEWNNKSTFSGSYNDLTNKPTIPTKTSQLTNDSNFLTKHQDISGKADKTELHNHTNKTVLDKITSAKVQSWDNKSTFSGDYNDLTNKPTIPSLSGYATEEFVKNEIAKIDTSVDVVDSVEQMVDTNKQYVHSGTNTWWKYKKVTIPAGGVLSNVDNAIKWSTTEFVLNKRLNSSATEVDAPGCAIFYFTFNDEMKNILNTIDPVWIRMKGCSMYQTIGNQTSTKVVAWNSNGVGLTNLSPFSQVLMYEETKNGISSNPHSNALFPYSDNKVAPVTAIKFGYFNKTVSDNSTNGKISTYASIVDGKFALSLIVDFANTNPITESDLENVYITFNEPIVSYEEQTISEWYDTGIEYNPNDDSSIVELKTRVNDVELKTNDLETRVIKLEKDTPSNSGGNETTTSTLPSYWKNRLDEISPRIDALQKEYGVDAFQFLWASDIHSVPGSSPNNTTEIGNICRYMLDKHNIPFFAISGDIMSQGSHSTVDRVWNEYDKLNTMLSPIRNDEFLATKGNHDGAWGSPVNGVYYLNNIGTKELFNAFYRRQTLDRNRVFGKDGTYFYVDCPNVRFYMLNTHTDGDGSKNSDGSAVYNPMKHFVLGNEQLNWIADSLLTVQEGQKVIFMGHAPIKACIDGSIFTGILTSYKNRNSYEGTVNITGAYWGTNEKYSKVSVNKDFTSAKGDLVGYFHGHIHKDTISTEGDYPIISITTAGGDLRDEYLTNGTLTRVKGSPTETAIDLVTVTGDYIYFTRLGSGYDRKYNRLTKEITIDYDSAYVPPTEEPDELPDGVVNLIDTGELYLNQRYSHSGGGIVSDGTGMFALIVPFETNGSTTHTLKFRNLSIPLNSASGSTLYGLDSNKGNSQTINGSVIPTMSDLTILDNGKSAEIKFTAPSSVKYLALTIRVKNESAITESDIADYIITLDEDGVTTPPTQDGLTQGEITSEVTWIADKRLSSSSGGYSDLTGCYASSDISCKNGDVIRIYGASVWKYYAYVAGYKSDNTFTGVITMETTSTGANNFIEVIKSTDNTLTITVIHDSISYIRVCNSGGLVPSNIRISRNIELQ